MKKLLLFVVCVLALTVNAQKIDVLFDGGAFSMSSPNGLYVAGNMEDAAVYYNTETKKIIALEGEIQDDGGCFVWDINENCALDASLDIGLHPSFLSSILDGSLYLGFKYKK